jgi:hypothetical protein
MTIHWFSIEPPFRKYIYTSAGIFYNILQSNGKDFTIKWESIPGFYQQQGSACLGLSKNRTKLIKPYFYNFIELHKPEI